MWKTARSFTLTQTDSHLCNYAKNFTFGAALPELKQSERFKMTGRDNEYANCNLVLLKLQ